VAALHVWYRRTARDLPWRRTRDPYAVWISEVMLQQTQVATVLPYFQRWMEAFPDVASLAAADLEDVLRLWEGLGYYSRARNLHRAAAEVARRLGGVIPDDPEAFRSLPGVGAYTCAAVMSIAFDRDMAVIDGNVKRVLSRLAALSPPSAAVIDELARKLLPRGTAALHNQAMMELGALVCTPRSPRCAGCPLRGVCRARAGDPERYPKKAPMPAVPHRRFAVGLVLRDGVVLIDRRPPGGLLGGLWEFPRVELDDEGTDGSTLAAGLRRDLHIAVEPRRALAEVHHAYSHFRVTLRPWLCAANAGATRAAEGRTTRWVRPSELSGFPMSTADRKVMRGLLEALEGQGQG